MNNYHRPFVSATCGYGKYFWNDGDVYEGEFRKNLKEGKGKLTFNDGTVINAIWKNDDPIILLNT